MPHCRSRRCPRPAWHRRLSVARYMVIAPSTMIRGALAWRYAAGKGTHMATVLDVAAYILEKSGPMTAMKLQKLAYYSQAWSLVWDDAPLFEDRIEAWANGPVAPSLYRIHRGMFGVAPGLAGLGDADSLEPAQKATVDAVLGFYNERTPSELSDLTHRESPWAEARGDLPPGATSSKEIPISAMNEYYGALYASRPE